MSLFLAITELHRVDSGSRISIISDDQKSSSDSLFVSDQSKSSVGAVSEINAATGDNCMV